MLQAVRSNYSCELPALRQGQKQPPQVRWPRRRASAGVKTMPTKPCTIRFSCNDSSWMPAGEGSGMRPSSNTKTSGGAAARNRFTGTSLADSVWIDWKSMHSSTSLRRMWQPLLLVLGSHIDDHAAISSVSVSAMVTSVCHVQRSSSQAVSSRWSRATSGQSGFSVR